MDQSELFGRVLKVAAAKPQKESNEGLGSKTAVWEQVCGYKIWGTFWLLKLTVFRFQEGWLARHAVSEEDKFATEPNQDNSDPRPNDPMQGLEGLDVAGPQPV